MCSTSITSASSSSVMPLPACSWSNERTASAISRRPPYPTATLTSRPGASRVASSASLSLRAVEAGRRSSAPTGCNRHRFSLGEGGDRALDDPQQPGQLVGRTVEVVGRQQPQRDHLDPDLLAPVEERLDVGGARTVAVCRVGPDGLRPPAVPVEHHAHVLGELIGGKGPDHPRLVRRVEHPPHCVLPPRHVPMLLPGLTHSVDRRCDTTFIQSPFSVPGHRVPSKT